MSAKELVTPAMVQEVSRSAKDVSLLGWTLSFDIVARAAKVNEWDGCFYQLKLAAARRIAKEINGRAPWEKIRRMLPVQPEVLEGEITDTVPVKPTKAALVTPATAAIPRRDRHRLT